MHFYACIPNIFEAMHAAGIQDACTDGEPAPTANPTKTNQQRTG